MLTAYALTVPPSAPMPLGAALVIVDTHLLLAALVAVAAIAGGVIFERALVTWRGRRPALRIVERAGPSLARRAA